MNRCTLNHTMKTLPLFFLIVTFFFSCKTRHKNSSVLLPVTTIAVDTTDQTTGQGTAICRVVVSFISRGEGTDQGALNLLQSYIAGFKENEGVLAQSINKPWGREGEIDYCFPLDGFTLSQQSKFVDGLKELFKENNLIHVMENHSQK